VVAPLRRRRFVHALIDQATALTRRSFSVCGDRVQGPNFEGPPRWRQRRPDM
jgi:hypothetical protein